MKEKMKGFDFSNDHYTKDNTAVKGENSYFIHTDSACVDANTGIATEYELTSTATPYAVHYWSPSNYQYPVWYPYPYYTYPAVSEENKTEKAFEIAKMLAENDLVHFSSVEKFIKLVENLKETL